jgi:serine/threonine-protein phosphatase PPG1
MEGYQILFDDMLSTIWSAPNYCYRAGNLASILEISPSLDRYFNVFGPCPEEERGNIVSMEPLDRLEELLDMDGINKKRSELLKSGSTSGHFIQDIYTVQAVGNQVMAY